MTNLNGGGRKRPWSNLRCYPGIFLEGLKKTTKTSVKIADLLAQISTRHFKNKKQKC
jgi:hypothetical protein